MPTLILVTHDNERRCRCQRRLRLVDGQLKGGRDLAALVWREWRSPADVFGSLYALAVACAGVRAYW